ncbi:preprotein translocase subunit YajC [bacterium]|nr:preprotein translocase subunit YajC [bacterium]
MMNLLISTAWAQDAAAPGPQGGVLGMIAPILIMFVIFYFLMIRPQQKQQKLRKLMLDNLKRGDEVVTTSGIYGKITDITDSTIMLQIAGSLTVKMERAHVNAVTNLPTPEKK